MPKKAKRRGSTTGGGSGGGDDDGSKNKKKRQNLTAEQIERLEGILAVEKEETKKIFEIERAEILESLPESVKRLFGQIGFAKFGKHVYGVLVLNPYDVPPGNARFEWLDTYQKLKDQGRLSSMTCLVYWYGTSNPDQYYGFIGQKEFVPYERGRHGSHFKSFEAAKAKMEKGKKLTKQETDRISALSEIEEDLAREQCDRKRGVTDFAEGYDMLTIEDLFDEHYPSEDSADAPQDAVQDGAWVNEEEGAGRPAKKKRGRPASKKSKVKEERLEDTGESGVEGGADSRQEAEPPKKKRKTSKKKRGSSEDGQLEEDSYHGEQCMEDEPQPGDTERRKKGRKADKHKRTKKKPATEEQPPPEAMGGATVAAPEGGAESVGAAAPLLQETGVVGGIEEFGDPETDESEDDDDDKKKDEDFRGDDDDLDVPQGDHDEAVLDETLGMGRGGSAVKKKKKSKKPAKVAVGGREAGKDRPSKKKQKTKHKLEAAPKPTSKKGENLKFHECEEAYLDLIYEYEDALKKDVANLASCIDRVTAIISEVSVPFMQVYLVGLVKETKLFFKSQSADVDEALLKKYKLLKNTMNDCYKAKQALVAEGYKPPARKVRQPICAAAPKSSVETSTPAASQLESSPQRERSRSGAGQQDPAYDTAAAPDAALNSSRQSGAPHRQQEQQQAAAQRSAIHTHRTGSQRSSADPSRSFAPPKWDAAQVPRKEGVAKAPALPKRDDVASKPQPKPERKAFSLGNLGRIMQKQQQDSGRRLSRPAQPKVLPSWLTGTATVDEAPSGCRGLGLDFLREMAAQFPPGKIDISSTALSLEKAIYEYTNKVANYVYIDSKTSVGKEDSRSVAEREEHEKKAEQIRWEDLYWQRVDAIVASVCGRKDNGTLMNLILNGEYATPDKVVGLDDKLLRKSFEGHLRF